MGSYLLGACWLSLSGVERYPLLGGSKINVLFLQEEQSGESALPRLSISRRVCYQRFHYNYDETYGVLMRCIEIISRLHGLSGATIDHNRSLDLYSKSVAVLAHFLSDKPFESITQVQNRNVKIIVISIISCICNISSRLLL